MNVILHRDPLPEALSEFALQHQLTLRHVDGGLPCAGDIVFTYLSDTDLRDCWGSIMEASWTLGVLPHPEGPRSRDAYGQKGKPEDVLKSLLEAPCLNVDSLMCNDQVVFSNVVLGEMLFFNLSKGQTFAQRCHIIKSYIGRFRQLLLQPFKVITAKEKSISTCALGLMIGQGKNHGAAPRFRSLAEGNDCRLTLMSLSPRSWLGFMGLWFHFFDRRPWSNKSLSDGLGLIRSTSVELDVPSGIGFSIDGIELSAKHVRAEVIQDSIKLLHPSGHDLSPAEASAKEEFKVETLPSEDAVLNLVGKPLPFFGHAGEVEFQELFNNLRSQSRLKWHFVILLCLSVALAMLGLHANSISVVIGAMILAPLMDPIVSMAMGLARGERKLWLRALITLSQGFAIAVGGGVLLTWINPLEMATHEILSRTNPTLLDLGVAIISGMAGAYVNAKSQLSKSLAGVSIAVALVPPLGVVGIGLGWSDLPMATGAFLLFATNLVGITLSASVTFVALGFSPFHLARRGLTWSGMMMALISLPLMLSFGQLLDRQNLMEVLPRGSILLGEQRIFIKPLHVHHYKDELTIEYQMHHQSGPHQVSIDALHDMLKTKLTRSVNLEVEWRWIR